jgi:itaconyl-CoA hydratase/mesaconyl-C4 CoA hydratase
LIAPQPFDVGGRLSETGVAALWAGNTDGLAQTAEVHFE